MRPGPSPGHDPKKSPAGLPAVDAEKLDRFKAAIAARRSHATPLEERAFKAYFDGLVRLPPIPKVATLLIPLLNRPTTPLAACVELIEMDQALTTAMLRCANSAAYFRGTMVANIKDAVVWIGLQEAACLALSLATKAVFDQRIRAAMAFVGSDGEAEWKRSVVTASAARNLSQRLRKGTPDLCYTVGLFQNVGHSLAAYILASLSSSDPEIGAMPMRARLNTVSRMRGVLTGEYLLREGLPLELAQLCFELEEPLDVPVDTTAQLIRVTLGLVAALDTGGDQKSSQIERALDAARRLGIDRAALDLAKTIILKSRDAVDNLDRNFAST